MRPGAPPGSRSTLERWIALLVRYWAYNMTLAFNQGSYYPGFGYSEDEKDTLKLVIPLLGPAAAVLSGAYYLSIRMRRSI